MKHLKKLKWIVMLVLAIEGLLLLIQAIKSNTPSFTFDSIVGNNGLLLEIHYGNLNCGAASLEIYKDKTYKFYDTFNAPPKEGTYEFDILTLLESSNSISGPYYITTGKGKIYCMAENNMYLKSFLESLDIDLKQCKLFTS